MSVNQTHLIIGITGGSCSGKTTLAQEIKCRFSGQVQIIQHDNYYFSRKGISQEQRRRINYDHPDAFETGLLVRHLHMLKAGRAVDSPIYDFTIHDRIQKVQRIDPAPLIIVDGIMILENKELRQCLDYKVFVEAKEDLRLQRRILRDAELRGRREADILRQFYETVQPMHEMFVEPCKRFADMIVSNDQNQAVIQKIAELLKD